MARSTGQLLLVYSSLLLMLGVFLRLGRATTREFSDAPILLGLAFLALGLVFAL